MTDEEIFGNLRELIVKTLGVPAEKVRMESVLVRDLGAESIDLLDLVFLIEQRFKITMNPGEIERAARARVPAGKYEENGLLTPEALAALRESMPGVSPDLIKPGLRTSDIPMLLTVAVFVRLIRERMNQETAVDCRQ